jgi:erythromycin esterase
VPTHIWIIGNLLDLLDSRLRGNIANMVLESLIIAGIISIKVAEDHDLRQRVVKLDSTLQISKPAGLAIRKAIGNSRLVMLGELTHGDGTSFEIKTALVKYLHEQAGFDILIWESAYYDCAVMNSALSGNKPLSSVAGLGVFQHWTSAKESFPIFEYARTSLQSKRPLTMAGFDLQSSGSASNSFFKNAIEWFKGYPEWSNLDLVTISKATTASQASPNSTEEYWVFRKVTDQAIALFQRAIQTNETRFDQLWGKESAFRKKSIELSTQYAKMLAMHSEFQAGKRAFHESYNLREMINAATVSHLMNRIYPGKKAIIWAHNAHIYKGQPALETGFSSQVPTDNIDAMGRMIGNTWGSQVYSLGFLANTGTWSWMGQTPIAFEPAAPGSIEALIRGVSDGNAFINLRNLPVTHPLAQNMNGWMNRQNGVINHTQWQKGFDGVIYIDEMKPRNQIP